MHLAEIWRYPVKSMAGESLAEARLERDGVEGDRRVQVRLGDMDSEAGERIVTARNRPQLLGHRATLGPGGEPLVDGRPWRAASVAADVARAVGAGARLELSDDVQLRYDILPLLVATDGAIGRLVGTRAGADVQDGPRGPQRAIDDPRDPRVGLAQLRVVDPDRVVLRAHRVSLP